MIKRKKSTHTNSHMEDMAMELFSTDAHFQVNKKLCRFCKSADKALFLANLIDKYRYFLNNNMLKSGGWFFQTHEQQSKETGLKEYTIKQAKKFFVSLGVLELRKFGVPAKEHYKISIFKLIELIRKSNAGLDPKKTVGLGGKKTKGLAPKKTDGHKDNIYKDNKTKENKKEKSILDFLKNGKVVNEKDDVNKLHPFFYSFIQQLPSNLQTKDVVCSVYEFFEYRKETKNKINSKITVTKLVNKIKDLNPDTIEETINNSIEKGWTGLFPKINGDNGKCYTPNKNNNTKIYNASSQYDPFDDDDYIPRDYYEIEEEYQKELKQEQRSKKYNPKNPNNSPDLPGFVPTPEDKMYMNDSPDPFDDD